MRPAAESFSRQTRLTKFANTIKALIVENRGLNFMVTALLIFAGLMIVQQFFFPKPKPPQGKEVAKKEQQDDDKSNKQDDKNKQDGKKNDKADKSKKDDQDKQKKSDDQKKSTKSKSDSTKQNDKKTNPEKTNPNNNNNPANLPNTFVKDQLLTIGSMDQTSGSRMLVTINRSGGTIRRIELNSRWPNGKLRYRDVENKSGYLGQLELTPVPGGLQVNLVGPGTPAALGDGENALAVGDILVSATNSKNQSATFATLDEFAEFMADTKPGEPITINLTRKTQNTTITIPLGDQPLNIVRPEPYLKYIDEDSGILTPRSPESMLLTIMSPSGNIWPELDTSMRTGLWDLDPRTTENEIILRKQIDLDALDQTKFAKPFTGKLTVFKRYKLLPGDPDFKSRSLDRAYHINFGFDLKYEGPGKHRFAFQLYGPTGTPVDGWWYQNKISGKTYSLFGTAGARDVIGNSKGAGYVFKGGPKIVANAVKDEPDHIRIFDPAKQDAGMMRYLAVDTQYFTVALLPDESYEADGERLMDLYSAYVWVCQSRIAEKKRERRTTDISYRLFSNDIVLSDGQTESFNFELFAGPKEPKLLKQYKLKDVRSFGWFAFVSKPLCWLLRLFYGMFSLIGLGSYGLAIILLTVIVRSLMIPISRKAALNAQMMQKLAPQMKEIAEKYKEDMEGRLKAQRELFSKNKYNPYGGCLLMFLQLPIFIGLYRGLSVDIALRDQPLIPGLKWCSNLAGPDQLWYWKDTLPSFLSFLTHETGWLGPYLNILPIITIVLFLMQQKLFTPPATDDQQKLMQKMMTFMMIFMGFLFFKVSAGLCIYFITSSAWGIIERKLLPKPVLKDIDGTVVESGSAEPNKPTPSEVVLKQSDEDKKKRERLRREREKRKRDKGRR